MFFSYFLCRVMIVESFFSPYIKQQEKIKTNGVMSGCHGNHAILNQKTIIMIIETNNITICAMPSYSTARAHTREVTFHSTSTCLALILLRFDQSRFYRSTAYIDIHV